MFWMLLPFASTSASPVPIPSVPSVAMNEFTRRTVTTKRVHEPEADPAEDGDEDARSRARGRGAGTARSRPARATRRGRPSSCPPTTDERMMLAPIEMSSSPAPSRNEIPTARRTTSAESSPMLVKLLAVEEDVVRRDDAEADGSVRGRRRLDPERGLLEEALNLDAWRMRSSAIAAVAATGRRSCVRRLVRPRRAWPTTTVGMSAFPGRSSATTRPCRSTTIRCGEPEHVRHVVRDERTPRPRSDAAGSCRGRSASGARRAQRSARPSGARSSAHFIGPRDRDRLPLSARQSSIATSSVASRSRARPARRPSLAAIVRSRARRTGRAGRAADSRPRKMFCAGAEMSGRARDPGRRSRCRAMRIPRRVELDRLPRMRISPPSAGRRRTWSSSGSTCRRRCRRRGRRSRRFGRDARARSAWTWPNSL